MKDATPHPAVPLTLRRLLLYGIPAFAVMPTSVTDELIGAFQEERFPAGTAMVTEGEFGDRLYFLVQGHADVSTPGAMTKVTLARLEPGDMFGEIALLAPSRRRQATVTAVTPVVALSLSAEAFERALAAWPEARVDLAAAADTLLTAKFIKQQGTWRHSADAKRGEG